MDFRQFSFFSKIIILLITFGDKQPTFIFLPVGANFMTLKYFDKRRIFLIFFALIIVIINIVINFSLKVSLSCLKKSV